MEMNWEFLTHLDEHQEKNIDSDGTKTEQYMDIVAVFQKPYI